MGLDEIYPPAIDVNMILNKVRFFKGDRWLEIGAMELTFNTRKTFVVDVQIPDIEGYFEKIEYLEDGSMDWLDWGARVN